MMRSRTAQVDRARRWWQEPSLRSVARGYERRQTSMMPIVLARVLSDLVGDDPAVSVLDLGSGPGMLLAELERLHPRWTLVGIDPDPSVRRERAEGDFNIVTGSCELGPELARTLTTRTLVVSSLTIALWNNPAHVLSATLSAAPTGSHALVLDLLHPDARSLETWLSFAEDDDERSYLSEQVATWLGVEHWATFLAHLRTEHPGASIEVACEDVRLMGMAPLRWNSEHERELERAGATGRPIGVLVRVATQS